MNCHYKTKMKEQRSAVETTFMGKGKAKLGTLEE